MMRDYTERQIVLASDEFTGSRAAVHSDEELRSLLESWEDMSVEGVPQSVDALVGPGTRDTDVLDLGVSVDELDPSDRDLVDDDLWADWICRGWLSDGRVWDDGRAVISGYRPPMMIGGRWEWQGGPVSVASHHGDQEQRWRRVSDLAGLRRAVEAAHDDEDVWSREQQRREQQRITEEAADRGWSESVSAAQAALRDALRERDDAIRGRHSEGWSGARISRVYGLSEMRISEIVRGI